MTCASFIALSRAFGELADEPAQPQHGDAVAELIGLAPACG